METNNFLDETERKIFDAVFNSEVEGLLLHGKPLRTTEELGEYINDNLTKYLTDEEINILINNNLGVPPNDDKIKALYITIFSHLEAIKLGQVIHLSLSKMESEGDNSYSIFTQPTEFLWHKYLKENCKSAIELPFHPSRPKESLN